MHGIQMITPCLWFDDQAEQAAKFYTSIFPNSRITAISRYSEVGHELHGQAAGSVMTVVFELNGQPFTALNGGPVFQFSEAISLQVICDSQQEINYYWDKLSEGGDAAAQQCGWLKDKYGVSWQVFPKILLDMFEDAETHGAKKAMQAMLGMKKMSFEELQQAYAG